MSHENLSPRCQRMSLFSRAAYRDPAGGKLDEKRPAKPMQSGYLAIELVDDDASAAGC
jgi:hypothetical protein